MQEVSNRIFKNGFFFSQVEEAIKRGEEVRIKAKGDSMYPLIREGKDDILLQKLEDRDTIKKGDVFLFRYQGRYILHRLIKQEGEKLTFRGDNVFGRIEQCYGKDIVGRAKCIYRGKGGNDFEHFTEVSPTSHLWRGYIFLRRLLFKIYLWVKHM